jgi:hypothetical protein
MFQFIKSAAHRDQDFVIPFPAAVVSRRRFPAPESDETRGAEEVAPARRAA